MRAGHTRRAKPGCVPVVKKPSTSNRVILAHIPIMPCVGFACRATPNERGFQKGQIAYFALSASWAILAILCRASSERKSHASMTACSSGGKIVGGLWRSCGVPVGVSESPGLVSTCPRSVASSSGTEALSPCACPGCERESPVGDSICPLPDSEFMVELKGIEPSTSTLRTSRSPN